MKELRLSCPLLDMCFKSLVIKERRVNKKKRANMLKKTEKLI
jgi:hypothetical protein